MDDADRVVIDEVLEALFQPEQALAHRQRSHRGLLDELVRLPVQGSVAGVERADLQDVFRPSQVIRFECARVTDGIGNVESAEVVGG